MQAYGPGFARLYNTKWHGFAEQVAPLIETFFAAASMGRENKSILDLCCGTGQLARHFLEKGYRVTGLDLSEHMLHYAIENARSYVESGQANFVRGEASRFVFEERFGLVISSYDALNHLENEQALRSCFECVHAVCDTCFVFDLNTRTGLNRWNRVNIDDSSEDTFVITRGHYDGEGDKAWNTVTGFVRLPNGVYERCDETAFNFVFDLDAVKNTLLELGWKSVHFARIEELNTPISEPENEQRVWIVASK
jgi:SAM-dependent methyltransferase